MTCPWSKSTNGYSGGIGIFLGHRTRLEKLAVAVALGALVIFPLAWLAEEPGLMLVYLLSPAVFLATVHRHKCRRCTFADCPANAVTALAPRHDV